MKEQLTVRFRSEVLATLELTVYKNGSAVLCILSTQAEGGNTPAKVISQWSEDWQDDHVALMQDIRQTAAAYADNWISASFVFTYQWTSIFEMPID